MAKPCDKVVIGMIKLSWNGGSDFLETILLSSCIIYIPQVSAKAKFRIWVTTMLCDMLSLSFLKRSNMQESDTFNIITQVLSAKYHGALIMDAVNYNLHGSLNIWCISKLLYKSIVVGPQFHSKNWAGTCIFIFLGIIEIATKLLPSFLKKK